MNEFSDPRNFFCFYSHIKVHFGGTSEILKTFIPMTLPPASYTYMAMAPKDHMQISLFGGKVKRSSLCQVEPTVF